MCQLTHAPERGNEREQNMSALTKAVRFVLKNEEASAGCPRRGSFCSGRQRRCYNYDPCAGYTSGTTWACGSCIRNHNFR